MLSWGSAQFSTGCVIFVAVVASGVYGSAPAAWLCCLKEQGRAEGSKSLERRQKGFGK